MKMGSLFSGIGGIELGLERAIPGLQTVWQVEKEEFCRSVLERHWPNTKRYNNVRTIGAHNLEPVDVICAGFPCQSISVCGNMEGLENEEKSGLWWHVHRLVSEFQSIGHQPILVLENVANIIRVGGPDVVGSLAAIGYDIEWTIISAAQCGAPHLRRRWFAVAYPSTIGYYMRNAMAFGELVNGRWTTANTNQNRGGTSNTIQPRRSSSDVHDTAGPTTNTNINTVSNKTETTTSDRTGVSPTTTEGSLSSQRGLRQWQSDVQHTGRSSVSFNQESNKSPNTNSQRIQEQSRHTQYMEQKQQSQCKSSQDGRTQQNYWKRFPTQSPVCRGNDGVPNRVDRLRALGNAVVPQCAEWVGQQIVKSGLLEAACSHKN